MALILGPFSPETHKIIQNELHHMTGREKSKHGDGFL
jgi:hypothetical protein